MTEQRRIARDLSITRQLETMAFDAECNASMEVGRAWLSQSPSVPRREPESTARAKYVAGMKAGWRTGNRGARTAGLPS